MNISVTVCSRRMLDGGLASRTRLQTHGWWCPVWRAQRARTTLAAAKRGGAVQWLSNVWLGEVCKATYPDGNLASVMGHVPRKPAFPGGGLRPSVQPVYCLSAVLKPALALKRPACVRPSLNCALHGVLAATCI